MILQTALDTERSTGSPAGVEVSSVRSRGGMSQLGIGMGTWTRTAGAAAAGRRVAVLVAAIVVFGLVGLLVGFGVQWFTNKPDYVGDGHGEVVVTITPGTGSTRSAVLEKDDVVRSASAFIAVAHRPDGANMQPGTYRLHLQMSAQAALTTAARPAREDLRVMIPEGMRTDAMLKLLATKTQSRPRPVQAVLAAPAALGLPAYARQRRGFPVPGDLRRRARREREGGAQDDGQRFAPGGDTSLGHARAGRAPDAYQVLVIASLVQAEGLRGLPEDRPRDPEPADAGMRLQLNSTVNFVLKNAKANCPPTTSPPRRRTTRTCTPACRRGRSTPRRGRHQRRARPGRRQLAVLGDRRTRRRARPSSPTPTPEFLQFKAELKANGG